MNQIRVRRKGQVTLPTELRRKLKIEEGTFLEAEVRSDGILLRRAAPLKAGKVIGNESYRRIMDELENTRKNWR